MMGLSPRTSFILSCSVIVVLILATIIGLTIALRTPPLKDGGSPPMPELNVTVTTAKATVMTVTAQEYTSGSPSTKMTTANIPVVTTQSGDCSEDGVCSTTIETQTSQSSPAA